MEQIYITSMFDANRMFCGYCVGGPAGRWGRLVMNWDEVHRLKSELERDGSTAVFSRPVAE